MESTRVTNSRLNPAIIISLAATAVFAPAVCQGQPASGYTISAFAGTAKTPGFAGDGDQATLAGINGPAGLMVDPSRGVFIADQLNSRIRLVGSDGVIVTVAGTKSADYSGDGGKATSASLHQPCGLVLDPTGIYYIGDSFSGVIRKVATAGDISTVMGLGPSNGFSGDGGTATSATMNYPCGLALDAAGNLYAADSLNNRIRKLTSATGIITTVAGDGTAGLGGDGGLAINAHLNAPRAIRFDAAGNMYIADTLGHRIRKVDTHGIITTVVGTGYAGFSGDGGLAISAQLNHPSDFVLDSAGNIYIADTNNSRIRVVSAANGVINTIAGNGSFSFSGDNGPALSAALNFPAGIVLGPYGSIYISDTQNHVVRQLTPPTGGTLPAINAKGVVSAGAFGAFTSVAPGSWVEIYGTSLAATTRMWDTKTDFKSLVAPTSLDGTSVKIGGQDAFISYVSPGQVNAQVPSGVAPGTQLMTVTTLAGTSSTYSIQVNDLQPGLLAFTVAGKQYVAALLPESTQDHPVFALPAGAISGVASRPAKPGEVVMLWGVGFGDVTPSVPAGRIAAGSTALVAQFQALFNGSVATLQYSGLAPGGVGLYQFNAVVPAIPDGLATPFSFKLNGAQGSQTLYIAVQR
jgi:uncharacterized protein (TIGR03437 family)